MSRAPFIVALLFLLPVGAYSIFSSVYTFQALRKECVERCAATSNVNAFLGTKPMRGRKVVRFFAGLGMVMTIIAVLAAVVGAVAMIASPPTSLSLME